MEMKQAQACCIKNPACFSRLRPIDPDLESGATFGKSALAIQLGFVRLSKDGL